MDIGRIQRILTALMIFSFLIFGLLTGIIFIADAPLDATTTSLPFAFLFISAMTLITTGQINNSPQRVEKYVREWLIICIFGAILAALTFTLA
ncbi:MAG: hypothetical protein ACFFE3_00550 [Candidatus Thorarchaeota archaeon]